MKKKMFHFLLVLGWSLSFSLMSFSISAQEDSVAAEEIVKLKYYNKNNGLQYLIIESLLKKGKKTEPIANTSITLYLDSVSGENKVGTVTTDKSGMAKSFIPVTLKSAWDGSARHKFIAQPAGKEEFTELEIVKSRMQIDTLSSDGVRSITVLVEKFENDSWVPVPEAELKVGVLRLGGILSAGDEAVYTTDSSGSVTVEVTRDSLPGDAKGMVVLAASIEENEELGNLVLEKKAAWGVPAPPAKNFFDQRTLWSTRFKTPFWLLFLAYSIILSVWGTLIYLIFQLIKIKKLGKESSV